MSASETGRFGRTAKASIRREMIFDTLRENPLSSTSDLSDIILKETGGAPTLLTGALWLPPWTIYTDLIWMEKRGMVERRVIPVRRLWWAVAGSVPSSD